MREPDPPHTTAQYTGPTQTQNAVHKADSCAPIDLTIELHTSHPSSTTTNIGKNTTPSDASDVMMQTNIDPTPKSPLLKTCKRLKPPLQRTTTIKKLFELQKIKSNASSGPAVSWHANDLDTKSRKHRRMPAHRPPGTEPIKIPQLTDLLDTYGDKQNKTIINNSLVQILTLS
jgi:hypothetical protein